MEWNLASNPPMDGKPVLIYWDKRSKWDDEKIFLGEYNLTLKCWRPMGCNGNYNDEVTHWMPLPAPPDSKKR